MASKRFYNIVTGEDRTADVYIYGDITSWRAVESDVSAYSFTSDINAVDADVIRVHVDSYGGEVSEGWAMYNALREHKAKIETYADGFVASAAVFPFLAGDVRQASPVSIFYLHEVSLMTYGYADDLQKAADEVRKMTEIGVQAFVERTNMDAEEVKALMAAETWLSPEEALDKGIVTKIVTERAAAGSQQSARMAVVGALLNRRAPAPEPTPAEPTEPAEKAEQTKPAEEAAKPEPKAETLLAKFARMSAKTKED